MPSDPGLIGVISDTHGLLREEALRELEGSELIIHAGDIGAPDIIDRLKTLAPVIAIRGNVDTAPWTAAFPATAATHACGAGIYVVHDVNELDLDPAAAGLGIVISGHSHRPSQAYRKSVLYLNPGSAGPRRFRLPVTVARVDLRRVPWKVQIVDLLNEQSDERNGRIDS